VYVNQAVSPVLVVLRSEPPLTPYRRRITIRRQPGGGPLHFAGHPGPGGHRQTACWSPRSTVRVPEGRSWKAATGLYRIRKHAGHHLGAGPV